MKKKTQALALGIASVAMVGIGTGVVEAAGPAFNPVYSACLTKQHTLINVTRTPARPDTCPAGTLAAHWNATGPAGPRGASGATGAQGMPGANGSTVLNGSGSPASTAGNVGDFYIDTTNWIIYGPKTSTGWPANGHALQGPAGASGGGGSSSTVNVTVVRSAQDVSLSNDTGYFTVASYTLPVGGKFIVQAKVVISQSSPEVPTSFGDNAPGDGDQDGDAPVSEPMAADCVLGFNAVQDAHPDTASVDLAGDPDTQLASATLTLMNDYDTTQAPANGPGYTVQLRCENRNHLVEQDPTAGDAVLVITRVDTLTDNSPGEVYTGQPT